MRPADEPAAAFVLVPLAVGVVAGGVIVCGGDEATALAADVVGIAVAVIALLVDRRARVVLLAGLIGALAGAARARFAVAPLVDDDIARRAGRVPVAVDGTIVESSRADRALRLVVAADAYRSAGGRGPARGRIAVTVAHPSRTWSPGMHVRFVARLRVPRNFGNPGGYDVRRALARRGILVGAFLWDDRALAGVGDDPVSVRAAVDGALASVRTAAGAAIDGAAAEPARGFLHAVLLGEDGALGDDVRHALARTGLSHVVSVSGFHLAVVATAAVLAARWMLLRSERLALRWNVAKLAALAGVWPVVAYAAIAGGSIPASRSLLMYATLLAAVVVQRRTDGLRGLAAAALVLALLVPDAGADISFELSFASVAALILVGASVSRGVRPPERRLARLAAIVAASLRVSCAAAAATAPLTAWHFQQVSAVAPIANLVALPLLGPATLLPGLAALPVLGVAPSLAAALLRGAALAAHAGLRLAAALAAVPGTAWETPMPNAGEVALAYALLTLPFWWRRHAEPACEGASIVRTRRRPTLRLAATVVLLALAAGDVAYWAWQRAANPRLRVTFLSVGQGDAAVVELPYGGVVVIDGGGFPGGFDPGERVIAPFLRSRKILAVDVLALSHPQLDHYGGLAYLAEHFAPRELWWNGLRARAPGFARLERALDAAGTRRVTLRRGARAFARDGVTVDVVHPAMPRDDDLNDGSLVLRLAYGAASVLFAGDVEAPAEREMVAGTSARDAGDRAVAPRAPSKRTVSDGDLASVVLKVAHHGSATSTTQSFVAAVAPRVAVISDGTDNRFGFPSPQVLRRLRAARVDVWRTDEDGAVQLETDGTRLEVRAPCASRAPRVFTLAPRGGS